MIEVLDHAPDAVLLPVLDARPEWSAYAVCDLDPPHRAHSRFVAAIEGDRTIAVALFYQLPGIHSLLPFGSEEGVEAIMRSTSDPPGTVFFLSEAYLLAAIETRYVIEAHWPMSRMSVHARSVASSPLCALSVRRLDARDTSHVQALYDLWDTIPFEAEMLEHGIYIGAWDGGDLVAVSGTHAVSQRRRIAAIGGVFTHPEYRNIGLATVTTQRVCHALAQLNIDVIVLNVRTDNSSAARVYEKLGFVHRVAYREGRAIAR